MGEKWEEFINRIKDSMKELYRVTKIFPKAYISGYINPKNSLISVYSNLGIASFSLFLYDQPGPFLDIKNFPNPTQDPTMPTILILTFISLPLITSYSYQILKKK